MPAKGKKNLPINLSTHKLIKQAAAELDTEMYLLVDAAWTCFAEQRRNQPIAQKGYAQVVETDDRKMIITNPLQNPSQGDISTLPDATHQELSQLTGRILAAAEQLAYVLGMQAHARRVSDRPADEYDEQKALVDEAEAIARRYTESPGYSEPSAIDAGGAGYRKRRKKA